MDFGVLRIIRTEVIQLYVDAICTEEMTYPQIQIYESWVNCTNQYDLDCDPRQILSSISVVYYKILYSVSNYNIN